MEVRLDLASKENNIVDSSLSVIKYDDYSLVVYDTYTSCLNDVNVKLILHPEMGHDWPSMQSYNINASSEIWNFVSKFDMYGLIN